MDAAENAAQLAVDKYQRGREAEYAKTIADSLAVLEIRHSDLPVKLGKLAEQLGNHYRVIADFWRAAGIATEQHHDITHTRYPVIQFRCGQRLPAARQHALP